MRIQDETYDFLLALLVITAALFASGCATMQEDNGHDFAPTWPEVADQPKATHGAIYAQGTEVSLWQNVTARNVGDTLTIRLIESTNAEKSASTTATKASSAEIAG